MPGAGEQTVGIKKDVFFLRNPVLNLGWFYFVLKKKGRK